jgi:SagB-type dehydrogenase family enzyme
VIDHAAVGTRPDGYGRAADDLAAAAAVRPVEEAPPAADSRRALGRLAAPGAPPEAAFPVTDVGPTRPFADVMHTRRSDRSLLPPDAASVGTVLARAGLVRARWAGPDGYHRTSRPAPSAGARHPHVLVLLARDVTGLPPGPWVLDPDRACLRPANHDPAQVQAALDRIGEALRTPAPPAAVVTVAAPGSTLARYPSGMSLLWRDAGALQATVHLAAADLGLASCVVGTAGILHAWNGTPGGLVDTGAVALGAAA